MFNNNKVFKIRKFNFYLNNSIIFQEKSKLLRFSLQKTILIITYISIRISFQKLEIRNTYL